MTRQGELECGAWVLLSDEQIGYPDHAWLIFKVLARDYYGLAEDAGHLLDFRVIKNRYNFVRVNIELESKVLWINLCVHPSERHCCGCLLAQVKSLDLRIRDDCRVRVDHAGPSRVLLSYNLVHFCFDLNLIWGGRLG